MDETTRHRLEKLAKDRERRGLEAQRQVLRGYQKKTSAAPSVPAGYHHEPVTNGDAGSPELVFSDGDVVMALAPD